MLMSKFELSLSADLARSRHDCPDSHSLAKLLCGHCRDAVPCQTWQPWRELRLHCLPLQIYWGGPSWLVAPVTLELVLYLRHEHRISQASPRSSTEPRYWYRSHSSSDRLVLGSDLAVLATIVCHARCLTVLARSPFETLTTLPL